MLNQQLSVKLSQKLSPQQIQLMKLIQLSTLELEQKIQNEIGENPALETGKESITDEDTFNENSYDENTSEIQDFNVDDYINDEEIPHYRTEIKNYSSDDDDKLIPFSGGISFHQNLKSQAQNLILDKNEKPIADFLIGSIDNSGYIRRNVDDLVDDIAFSENIYVTSTQIINVLRKVQTLDPPGVGARDLNESLIIQIKRKTNKNEIYGLAEKILSESFDHFSRKHFQKLIDKYKISKETLKQIIDIISKLNPKPGGGDLLGDTRKNQVVPDFILTLENGIPNVLLNRRNAPELHISQNYREMLKGYKESSLANKTKNETVHFIKQKLDSAKWFIDAINQRHQTLLITINAIVEHQKKYFITGDEKFLKPMILKDISEKINMDISTVSRVANSKYIDTPYGIKLLKSFFSEGIKNSEGDDISSIEVKNILEELIMNENKRKPLADMALSVLIKEKGYIVARRTVAKYREQLGLPVARLRKEI